MIAGVALVDVAISGAGNETVPWPGWSMDCTVDTACKSCSETRDVAVILGEEADCCGSWLVSNGACID